MKLNSHDISVLKNLLFGEIEISKIENIVKESAIFIREFSENSIVITKGKNYNWLLILSQGESVSEISSYSGKLVKIDYLKPPEVVAPACLFVERYEIPVTIKTVTPCRFIYIPKSEIENWLTCRFSFGEELFRNILKMISKKAINLSRRISFLTLHTIEEKFINYLLSIPPISVNKRENNEEITVKLSMSIEELAAYFGVERPSLSRAIGKLEREGIIFRDRKKGKTSQIFTLLL